MKEKIEKYYKENGIFKTIKWITKKIIFRIKRKINTYKTIHLKDGNDKEQLKNNRQKVFIFACVPYFDVGGGQRSSQISNVFKMKDYNVIYIYGIPSSESKIYKLEFPTVIHKYIKKYKIKEFKETISKNDIIIFEMPDKRFVPYLEIAKENEAKIIYENIDNWESSMGNEFFNKEILKIFLENSNLLTATSIPLKEQLENYLKEFKINDKKIIYSANAVNDKMFNPNNEYEKPNDMKIGKKTFLYYGSLWVECFDWTLIEDLANYNKNYAINIIGDEKTVPHIVEKMPENVYFLGLKKQKDLPNYLKYTDYTLFPFKNDEVGKYVSPLKIFEYISMNTRVLGTTLPDIIGLPNTCNATNFNEWKKEIEKNRQVDIKQSADFTKKNNWEYRVNEILKNIEGGKHEK